MKTLSELVASGAILTMPDGYRAIVADAIYSDTGTMLWWCEIFGREHFLEGNVKLTPDYNWLRFEGDENSAIVGDLEGTEDQEAWARWQEFLQTDEGRAAAEAIARMKDAALNWKA